MEEKKTKKRTTAKRAKKPVEAVAVEIEEAPKTITAIVATDRYPLNIRNAAESEANVIGQIPKGTKIKILDQPINGFYQLADQPGFVLGSKLKI